MQPSSGWQTNAPDDRVVLERPSPDYDRVTCLGASLAEPVVLVADQPLLGHGVVTVPYFEVTLLEGSSIILGLVSPIRNNDGGGPPGRKANSIGLFSNGDLISTITGHECSIPFASPFGMLDTVGIGCTSTSSTAVRVFATHNGRDLGVILQIDRARCPLFPAVAFADSGCIATIRRTRPFLFELPPSLTEASASNARSVPPPPPPSIGSPQQHVQSWLANHQANFTTSTVGRQLTRVFSVSSASKSSRLEADLLEAQEHISVLETVLGEQSQQQQNDLLKELTVSCRTLLVRHANLVREATDDESLNRILALNDRIIELLMSADRVLERSGGAPPKTVAPDASSGTASLFGPGSNLVAKGSANTVSEMLHMLRSGTGRSQKNAVQCLASLVRERTHNDMVVINGGVHAFVTLAKAEHADEDLRRLAARALAELASWVRISDDESTTTRGVIKAELGDVLRTFDLIANEEPLLVAQAVANIVLLLTATRPACNPTLNELAVPLFVRLLALDTEPELSLEPLTRVSSVSSMSSGHKRSLSWTAPSSSPPLPSEEPHKRRNELREASRVASFGLSMLVRRCDSAKTVVVNNPSFFLVLERLLQVNDEEILLHALSIIKGLVYAPPSDDNGFSQGFITARVLQSPSVLLNLCRIPRRAVEGAARHYYVASLTALVQHKSVLAALIDSVGFAEIVEAFFSTLALVMKGSSKNAARPNDAVEDESNFFNSHFRQQRAEFNAREYRIRIKLSDFRADNAWASTGGRRSSSGNVLTAASPKEKASSEGKRKETRPSLLWELVNLTNGILYVLSSWPSGSRAHFELSDEHFEQIVALTQVTTALVEGACDSDMDDSELQETVADVSRKGSSILVTISTRFRVASANLVAAGLMSLLKSEDDSIRVLALRAISEVARSVPDISLELLKANCAVKLCESRAIGKEHRAIIASTLAGLGRQIFETSVPLTSVLGSYHGFGPNDQALRFLLDAVESFEVDPSCATEACSALILACAGRSALATHFRSTLQKRVLLSASQMSMQCSTLEGQRAAEELIKVCGFSQGAMQVVANDALAIREWGSIKVDLDVAHRLIDLAIAHQAEGGWGQTAGQKSRQAIPYFDESVDGLRILLSDSQINNLGGSSTPPRGAARTPSDGAGVSGPNSRGSSPMTPQVPIREPGDESVRFGVGSMPQKFLSTVSDLKRPKRLFDAVVGQAEVIGERIVREVSMAESTMGAAANIIRAIAGTTPANKPWLDYQLACIETMRLLNADRHTDESFFGVEHSLSPTIRDLYQRVFWGMNTLLRYLGCTPIGFLTDERPVVLMSGKHHQAGRDLPYPWRVLRLQTDVNHWTGKLVHRVIGEQLGTSKTAASAARWGLVLPGTALGVTEDQKDYLVDILFTCPSISSLTFSGKAQESSGKSSTSATVPAQRLSSVTSSQGSADSSAGGEAASHSSLVRLESRPPAPPPPRPPRATGAATAQNSQTKVREQEEKLAQFLANMPSSVTWLSFDRNCLSPEGLRLVAAFLGLQTELVGCSITNSTYTLDEITDFLRYMSRSALSSTLRYVDLSGNVNLGDTGCAAAVRAFHNTKVVALDLSGIKLDGGGRTVDALLGVASSPASAGKDARGEAKLSEDGLLASTDLRYLSLARCSLSSESASRLLYALSKRGGVQGRPTCSLRVLDLDKNGLKGMRQALLSFLAFDVSVRELGFLENEIAPFISDVARAVASNKTLQILRHSGISGSTVPTPSAFSSAPGVVTQQNDVRFFVKQIDQALRRNRLDWVESRRTPLPQSVPPPSPRQLSDGEEEKAAEEVRLSFGATEKTVFVHVLFASPLVFRDSTGRLHPSDALDSDAEKQTLMMSLKEARDRSGAVGLELEFDFGCTTETLISVLTRKPSMLHFSTHGEDSYIAMEDGKGGLYALHIEHLEEMCRTANVAAFLKLVFVSACNSMATARAFLSAGVRCVVAVDSKIADKAAQVFTRAFYLSLALGDAIEAAFNIGKEAVRLSPLLNESAQSSGKNFVLIGEGKGSLFPQPKKQLIARLPPLKPQGADFPDPRKWRLTDSKFLEILVPGRNVDAYLTIVALYNKRVVMVLAPEGFGKSAILSGFVCRYLNERRMFEDGCVVLDLAGCKTVMQVQSKLNKLVRKPHMQHQSSSTEGSSLSGRLSAEAEEDELERTVSELAKRRCVLVLDHLDQILDMASDELRLFLGHILDRTKGLRIVLATRSSKPMSIPGHEHVALTLAPLSFLDSARLFLKCCPHYHNDVHARPRLGLPPPENFDQGLARHPLCAEMNGVAKTIVQTATSITYEQWLEVVEEVTEALMYAPFAFPRSPKPSELS